MKNHIYWIDYVKVVACVLVALGHFFMSMTARIMPVNNIYNWFIQTIYYFHVPLFFICSGYLYQKFTNISCVKEWYRNILKKLLNLGIPFFVFSTITWVLKTLFSSSVNTQVDSLYQILFTNPTAPYWYLYCLFFVFLVTPVIKNLKQGYLILAISLAMKFLSIAGIKTGIYMHYLQF